MSPSHNPRERPNPKLSRLGLFILLLPVCAAALDRSAQSQAFHASPARAQPPSLPLTTTRQVHALTSQQAAQGLPIHLRAVVTYYDPYLDPRHIALFVQDETGGTFVAIQHGSEVSLHAGSLVDIDGISAPGDFASMVAASRVTVVKDSVAFPKPAHFSISHLMTGVEDSQWVEIEGIVHSFSILGMSVNLKVMTDGGLITAVTVRQPGVDYARLVDTKVRIRGAAGALYNSKRQLTGIRLMVPNVSAISVENEPQRAPLALPVTPFNNLMRYGPDMVLPHRVHVQGRVTLSWPGRLLCLQNGDEGLCMQTSDKSRLSSGELVDVAGFPTLVNYQPTLSEAILLRIGDTQPIVAKNVNAAEVAGVTQTGKLVRIEGRLIGKSVGVDESALLLSSGQIVFPVILPNTANGSGQSLGSRWSEGSRISVTGIFSAQIDAQKTSEQTGVARLESFQILLRSPSDMVLLQAPSWWTGQHTILVLGAVLTLTLAVIFWVIVLRRRVRQQTQLIRLSEERFRRQAEEDSLTGVASRALFHEQLSRAIDAAVRDHTRLALLMMDLDNFKQVNDTLGHPAGDMVLCTTAARIRACVRKTDTVARMGGDEFIVLMPQAPDVCGLERIAGDLVARVAMPVEIEGSEVPVSMSVGIAFFPENGQDAVTLLHNVDLALYRAKACGRNRYQVFTAEMAKPERSDWNLVHELTAPS